MGAKLIESRSGVGGGREIDISTRASKALGKNTCMHACITYDIS